MFVKVSYLLNSKKIKLFGIIGTFTIISTAYVLHAKTFYTQLYPTIEVQKTETKLEKLPIKEPDFELEAIEVEKIVKISDKPKVSLVHPAEKLDQILSKYKYIHVDKLGEISQTGKEMLKEVIPLLSELNDSYIELEGHSASEIYSYMTQRRSEQSAQIIERYLRDKKVDKKIIITGYGDLYPIIDDKKDKRNSRVELKIRRR